MTSLFWGVVEAGAAILRMQERLVRSICGKAAAFNLGDGLVPVVQTPVLVSEVGEALNAAHLEAPYSVSFFDDYGKGQRIWSFRTRHPGVDVGLVATRYGGGGHPGSAGCQTAIGEILYGASAILKERS